MKTPKPICIYCGEKITDVLRAYPGYPETGQLFCGSMCYIRAMRSEWDERDGAVAPPPLESNTHVTQPCEKSDR